MGWNYVAKSSTLWLSVPVLVIVLFIAATALRAYRRYLRSEREKAKGCHDAIFVLGGHRSREHYAARIACIGGNRHLPIFVSSGSYWKIRDFDPLNLSNPFRESFTGVDFKSLRTRLHLDRRAIDTVTNFTSMVRVFKDKGIKHVLVITSKSHIARGYAIAKIIFGGEGIAVTMVKCEEEECNNPRRSSDKRLEAAAAAAAAGETYLRLFRDVARAILWRFTGCDGRTVAGWVHPERLKT
mmetsp:Transcript_23722/g.40088  ORF Transcript_23722/g.40088 Transcript_23722/m.40088 type:complete len:240 (-) Transcript_23722:144-863(-)